MFSIFKKGKKSSLPPLNDMDGQPLKVGDLVISYRYELGKCQLIMEDDVFYYVSLDGTERVSWLKMIDAATENQKVKKLSEV